MQDSGLRIQDSELRTQNSGRFLWEPTLRSDQSTSRPILDSDS